MKIILPVAGKGTRLRPHTHTKPKSLVRVAGKTVLEHVMDNLAGLKVDQFILITDENGAVVEEFFRSHFPKANAVFLPQVELLGPAHAVSLAAPHVKKGDDLLIVFNDTLFVTDLTRIPKLCAKYDGLIYSKEVEDYKRFGVNVMKDGAIADMIEKPDRPVSKLAQVGLYYVKDGAAFMGFIQKAIEAKLTVKGEYYLPAVFKLMIAAGSRLAAPEIEEWLDCGKPETLLATNRYLLERSSKTTPAIEGSVIIPPVFIHPSAKVVHSVIGPFVSVAEGCVIEDSVIKDSVVNAEADLTNVMLNDSIIGDSVTLTGASQRLNIGDNSVIDMGSGRA
ncbi:MAG: NTP transferase domain-containing protein [Elusimicrobia bacterium]|nr:NTP transferase domain-containing protein [Elusimicrobiota bacterium]